MKSWVPLVIAIVGLLATGAARRQYRTNLTTWLAARLGKGAASGRSRAIAILGGMCVLALIVLAVGVWATFGTHELPWLRYVCGIVVLVGYAPIATLGSPKMTKWQKGYDHALIQRGADPDAARAAAGVARIISSVGLLIALGSLLLLMPGL